MWPKKKAVPNSKVVFDNARICLVLPVSSVKLAMVHENLILHIYVMKFLEIKDPLYQISLPGCVTLSHLLILCMACS